MRRAPRVVRATFGFSATYSESHACTIGPDAALPPRRQGRRPSPHTVQAVPSWLPARDRVQRVVAETTMSARRDAEGEGRTPAGDRGQDRALELARAIEGAKPFLGRLATAVGEGWSAAPWWPRRCDRGCAARHGRDTAGGRVDDDPTRGRRRRRERADHGPVGSRPRSACARTKRGAAVGSPKPRMGPRPAPAGGSPAHGSRTRVGRDNVGSYGGATSTTDTGVPSAADWPRSGPPVAPSRGSSRLRRPREVRSPRRPVAARTPRGSTHHPHRPPARNAWRGRCGGPQRLLRSPS